MSSELQQNKHSLEKLSERWEVEEIKSGRQIEEGQRVDDDELGELNGRKIELLFDPKINVKTLRMKSFLWIKSPEEYQVSAVLAQLFPTLILNLAAISSGVSIGFNLIVTTQLKEMLSSTSLNSNNLVQDTQQENDLYQPFVINDTNASLIESVFMIGAIIGAPLSAIFCSHYGKRNCLLAVIVPELLGWIIIAGSQNLTMMLVGRFLNGLSISAYIPAIQIYIAEITQPQHRGWLSAITIPALALGTLLSYTLGSVVSWPWLTLLACLFPLFLLPGLIYLPKSPYWYLQKNEDKEALKVLKSFRSTRSDSLGEILAISHSIKVSVVNQFSIKEAVSHAFSRQYRRPFLILNFLCLLMVSSGDFAISSYATELLIKSSIKFNVYTSTIIIGLLKLAGSLCFVLAMRYAPRRIILLIASTVMAICMAVLGIFSTIADDPNNDIRKEGSIWWWTSLIGIMIYLFVYQTGLGSMPFTMMSEIYPSDKRSILSGITFGFIYLEYFLITRTSVPFNGLHLGDNTFMFWFYCCVCLLTASFAVLFLPETRGKTLQEMEHYFRFKKPLHATPLPSPIQTPISSKKNFVPQVNQSLQFTI